ncbi:hypothetical protein [Mycobacterium colombiense]|uniref:hypothetical protein n=1 Tax=Mycobacterium colombiense TaxID=339268 RepID=UPI0012DAF956|nr:hypothetical protein [Mycobacterium colombiense]
MAVDLPPGTWTAALIGPWWPAPSTGLRSGAQHWSQECAEQQLFSQNLRAQWTAFAATNKGHTADDLITRFQQGERLHLDLAEKYQTKASAFNSGADAIDYLRSRLSDIANTGNKEINDILASKKLPPEKLAEVQAVQARCNADAANASRDAADKMMAATQKILDAEGIGGNARSWAQANGFDVGDAKPPNPISAHDLNPVVGGGGKGSGGGASGGASGGGPAPAHSVVGGGGSGDDHEPPVITGATEAPPPVAAGAGDAVGGASTGAAIGMNAPALGTVGVTAGVA